MTMIERVAQALEDELTKHGHSDYDAMARAAITAMREPTEAMITAGAYGSGEDSGGVATGAWEAMIDEALRDTK